MRWASELRDILRDRAAAWAVATSAQHYQSLGERPTILFEKSSDGATHGNFHEASWRKICENPGWLTRLDKLHSQRRALPPGKAADASELDSSNSSDALLMNCFCFPGAAAQILRKLNISATGKLPDFGFKARLPLVDGAEDATEIDMRIGNVLFEAKLTEANFTSQSLDHLRRYRDLDEHFLIAELPRSGEQIAGYQLVRNVLAAAYHDTSLVVLLDGRRPDLLHEWWKVHSAIRSARLRSRCGFRTWQQVAAASPPGLACFLHTKYDL